MTDPWLICGIILATPKLLAIAFLVALCWWELRGDK